MICPLHGFVWRNNIGDLISKYTNWSRYEPEETGVMIAYASVYGNTENAAEILSCRLRDCGIKTVMFDVSVTPASDIVSAAFRWSHMVFASTTYNAEIFVTMEALINDLTAHNIQNRTVAIIENGSWAAASGGLIREKLEKCKNIKLIEKMISIESSLKLSQLSEIDEMIDMLIATMPDKKVYNANVTQNNQAALNAVDAIDMKTMFKLSYGLFVLTAKDGAKDNGCIINTVIQITEKPLRVNIVVNKANLTHDMILKTGEFNISILTESAPFRIFEQFGFHSGKDTDKFAGDSSDARTTNNIRYLPEYANVIISAKVKDSFDYGTHTLFIADVTQSFMLSDEPSVTYQYYFAHIKPKPQLPKGKKKGFVCKICGYVHEGETLPDDFICPLCKHGAADFEPL
jgi:flavin reductase (DIM6/NTAB) family NADH-FMN oxidoreductase RutF/flavodoxin